MVPVGRAQVGCAVTLAAGVAGIAGWLVIVTLVAGLVHPPVFLAVRL
jgi:hypothetical protein